MNCHTGPPSRCCVLTRANPLRNITAAPIEDHFKKDPDP